MGGRTKYHQNTQNFTEATRDWASAPRLPVWPATQQASIGIAQELSALPTKRSPQPLRVPQPSPGSGPGPGPSPGPDGTGPRHQTGPGPRSRAGPKTGSRPRTLHGTRPGPGPGAGLVPALGSGLGPKGIEIPSGKVSGGLWASMGFPD